MSGRDFDELFAGLDGLRPVPPALLSRLEESLFAAAGEDELVTQLAGQDGPRPLPADLRSRLEASLVANRSVPRRLRRRVEQTLVVVRSPSRRARIGAAAAAVLLVLGLTIVAVSGGGGSGGDRDGDQLARPPVARGKEHSSGGSAGGATASDLEAGVGSSPSGQAARRGVGTTVAGDSVGASGGGASASRGPVPPLRLGVVRGDQAVEAGFDAYVERLNRNGDVAGRVVEVVATSETAPATDTLATVNLSGTPLTGSWAQLPLLEAAEATEATLVNEVFSFTSVLERQAHLAVAAAFPEAAPGATAAIYHARSGPYATRVPAAVEEALRAKGVTSVRVLVGAGAPALVPAADAAFASLEGDGLRAFLTAARDDGYAPDRGLWGIASLFDEELVGTLPASSRVLSPYTLPDANEATALRDRSGRPLSAATVHGWVTATMLAAALEQSNAATPSELTQALDRLAGYENGFMPPYEVRKGTRSRTPEGLVLVPEGDGFRAASDFMRDRF